MFQQRRKMESIPSVFSAFQTIVVEEIIKCESNPLYYSYTLSIIPALEETFSLMNKQWQGIQLFDTSVVCSSGDMFGYFTCKNSCSMCVPNWSLVISKQSGLYRPDRKI